MAKSNANSEMNLIRQGFDQIDISIASEDPEVGALLDMFIDKLSIPMARRMGIDPRALKQLALHIIRGRAQEKFQEEKETTRTKMVTAQGLGSAMRQADVQLTGLKLEREAFNTSLMKRYVGAALAAAGSFIGQGIAAGLFKKDEKGLLEGMEELEMMSGQTKAQIEGLPSDLSMQSGQLKTSIEELGAGYEPIVRGLGPDVAGKLDMQYKTPKIVPGMEPRNWASTPELDRPGFMVEPGSADRSFKEIDVAPTPKRQLDSSEESDVSRWENMPMNPLSGGDFEMGKSSRLAALQRNKHFRLKDDKEELEAALEALRGLVA